MPKNDRLTLQDGSLDLDEQILRNFYYEPHELGKYPIYRRVLTLEKSGLIGRIGEYKLLDFIAPTMTVDQLLPLLKPIPDVMVQRFLLGGEGKMIKKSFAWGFRGWAYIGFLEGNENFFEDMRKEFLEALKPSFK
jgi:hypothetical protein